MGGTVGTGGAGVGGASGAGGAAVFSCTEPRELDVAGVPTGIYACDEGYEVRAEQVTCPNLLPSKGQGGAPGSGGCTSHADCPGALDFCSYSGNPFGTFCREGCQTDADCEPGSICRCGDPIGECFEAGCATTADCEPGSFCASVVDTSCYAVYQYACLGAEDGCRTDADCIDPALGDWCTLVDGLRRCALRRPCR
jgi:hypothetical protein